MKRQVFPMDPRSINRKGNGDGDKGAGHGAPRFEDEAEAHADAAEGEEGGEDAPGVDFFERIGPVVFVDEHIDEVRRGLPQVVGDDGEEGEAGEETEGVFVEAVAPFAPEAVEVERREAGERRHEGEAVVVKLGRAEREDDKGDKGPERGEDRGLNARRAFAR